MQWRIARFIAGATAGSLLWWFATPSYNVVLGRAVAPLLRIDHRFITADLSPDDRQIRVKPQRGNEPPAAQVPADQLTYNVILLVGLFASNRRPFNDSNMRGLGLSLLTMSGVHCVALIVSIEATYAFRLGAWSEAHYSTVAANFWVGAELLYRLTGMFAVAFLCWWLSATERA